MKRHRHATVWAAMIAAMTVFGVIGAGKQAKQDAMRLVAGGRPFVKVQRISRDAAVITAQDEFVNYMNAILGRADYNVRHGHADGAYTLKLAIAGDWSCKEADRLMEENRQSPETLGNDGFLLARSGKRDVMLCAYSGKGVLNGVYKIFEKSFGIVAPRPLVGLDFPFGLGAKAKEIPLPYIDRPAFRIRALCPTSGGKYPLPDMRLWMARTCLNAWQSSTATFLNMGWSDAPYGFIQIMCGHSFNFWVPANEYFETHPEYYSLIDGKRSPARAGSQLTLGNPEVIDLIVKRMLTYLDKYPEMKCLAFGYNDAAGGKNPFGWGEDPLDLALDSPNDLPKPGSKRGRTWSTRYIKAANQVAERVCKVHPKVQIGVYAYHHCMLPPPDCPVHPNLLVQFAPMYMCQSHAVNDPNCRRNRYIHECLSGWAKKTSNIYVREYYSGFNHHFPLATPSIIKKNLMCYRDLGIAGFSPETIPDAPFDEKKFGGRRPERHHEDYWDASALAHFALARFGWNPDESVEDVVGLFCRSYYGPSVGPRMAKYFLAVDANRVKSSHPGERAPNDDPANDSYVSGGPWCFSWNWVMAVTSYSKRLFMTDRPEEVEKNAMPLLELIHDARLAANDAGYPARARVRKDYELFKMYLLAFGYETLDFKMRRKGSRPQFSVKGSVFSPASSAPARNE